MFGAHQLGKLNVTRGTWWAFQVELNQEWTFQGDSRGAWTSTASPNPGGMALDSRACHRGTHFMMAAR